MSDAIRCISLDPDVGPDGAPLVQLNLLALGLSSHATLNAEQAADLATRLGVALRAAERAAEQVRANRAAVPAPPRLALVPPRRDTP
jgi:hypothetical protein